MTANTRGARIGRVAAGLVLLMLGAYLVLRGIGFSFGIPGTLVYFAVTLVLTAVLVLTAKYVDRNLPDDEGPA
jgi:4-hydroxybenzoate polyprenyltransferase